MRSLIEKLTAIQEDRPSVGDGFLLEFGDKIEVETEILEFADDAIVLLADDKLMHILESLSEMDDKYGSRPGYGLMRARDLGGPDNMEHIRDGYYVVFEDHSDDDVRKTSFVLFKKVKETKDQFTPAFEFVKDLPLSPYRVSQQQIIQAAEEAIQHDMSESVNEAEYHGRQVPLGKPMAGDVKKKKVYVKDPKTGNIKKINFGQKGVKIKKNNPARRKSFRARHNCKTAKDRTTARYWSCRAW